MTDAGGDGARPADLKEATLSGVRWISVARIASEVIAFASMVVLARLIGPTGFGQFAIAIVVREIALTMTGEGIGTALVQRTTVERKHLEAGMFLSISLAVLLGAAAYLSAPLIFAPIFGDGAAALVQLSTPMFLIAGVAAVPLAMLQRQLDFKLISIFQVASGLAGAIASLALAFAGLEGAALVLGVTAGSATSMLLAWFAALPRGRGGSMPRARSVASASQRRSRG